MGEETAESRPLNDVMLAMDVVDTLRHQDLLVERELNAENRDQKMLERLKEIYKSQGIEVPERILHEGVQALKEDRFVYEPPPKGLETWLARVYVSRLKWGKPVLGALASIVIIWVAYVFIVSGPAERERTALPQTLQSQYAQLIEQAKEPAAVERIHSLFGQGQSALQKDDTDTVRNVLTRMNDLQSELEREYELRIVSRPGEKSGVWRIPDANTNARNYYLIVEAVTPAGEVLELPIRSEEDGKTARVDKWGLRVDERVFERIANDKMDDGIIQQNRFGTKKRGYLTPEYELPTTGNAITSW